MKLDRRTVTPYPPDGRCRRCGKERRRLVADHDHRTGVFRGWICPSCNALCGLYDHRLQRPVEAERTRRYLAGLGPEQPVTETPAPVELKQQGWAYLTPWQRLTTEERGAALKAYLEPKPRRPFRYPAPRELRPLYGEP